jgi:hypothetical protein
VDPGEVGRSGRSERRGTFVLLAVGTLAANLLLLSVWAWWAFGTQNGFADQTVDMMKDPYVRDVVADQIIDALEDHGMTAQVAMGARPVLEPVVATIVGTDEFKGILYAGARQLHVTVFQGRNDRMLVGVNDAGAIVKESVRVSNPGIAAAIPDEALDIAVGLSQNTRLDALIRAAAITGWMIWPLVATGLACFGAAIARSFDRRRTVLRIGLLLAASGLLWLVLLLVGVTTISRMVDSARDRAAARAVFRAVTHVLMLEARVALTAGIVITLAALVAGEERVRSRVQAAGERVQYEWQRPVLHGVLGGLILVMGVLVTVYPEVVLAMSARAIGILLAFLGLVAVLDVLGAYGWSEAGDGREARTLRHVAVICGAASLSIAALLSFGGMALYSSLHEARSVAPNPDRHGCNGHKELCDLRLDQVVLAGTHNSMASSTEEGWWFARQRGGIGAQLARGVRAFLVDAHYGTPIGAVVRTDFLNDMDKKRSDAEVTPLQRAEAASLFAFVGATAPAGSKSDVYLCHLYCEVGATLAEDAFRLIDGFLAENPNEVVVIVVEDHVASGDLQEAVHRSRLDRRAYEYRSGEPLPTLREMIESRHNVLLMAEVSSGTEQWYPAGYEQLMQDTSYSVPSVEDFTCGINRGAEDNPLLLMNHWVANGLFDPELAAEVNAREILLARAEECQRDRDRLPNIIAVDHYTKGDLFDVVDELNGVGTDTSSVPTP